MPGHKFLCFALWRTFQARSTRNCRRFVWIKSFIVLKIKKNEKNMEELEKQNSEWLAMRKMVHRRARIELDNIYIYYMRRLKKLRKLQSKE
jgi:hypothetical protein